MAPIGDSRDRHIEHLRGDLRRAAPVCPIAVGASPQADRDIHLKLNSYI